MRVNIGMPVVRTVGRAVGRSVYGHVITKFSRMGSLPHFLTHGVPQAPFARQSSARNSSVKIWSNKFQMVMISYSKLYASL